MTAQRKTAAAHLADLAAVRWEFNVLASELRCGCRRDLKPGDPVVSKTEPAPSPLKSTGLLMCVPCAVRERADFERARADLEQRAERERQEVELYVDGPASSVLAESMRAVMVGAMDAFKRIKCVPFEIRPPCRLAEIASKIASRFVGQRADAAVMTTMLAQIESAIGAEFRPVSPINDGDAMPVRIRTTLPRETARDVLDAVMVETRLPLFVLESVAAQPQSGEGDAPWWEALCDQLGRPCRWISPAGRCFLAERWELTESGTAAVVMRSEDGYSLSVVLQEGETMAQNGWRLTPWGST